MFEVMTIFSSPAIAGEVARRSRSEVRDGGGLFPYSPSFAFSSSLTAAGLALPPVAFMT